MRILFASDSIQDPPTGVGRVAATLLAELCRLGHEVLPVDWRDNGIARSIAGSCHVLRPRLPVARTALWHLELLRRVSACPRHDVLFDPSGYPCALGQHPALAVMVHDLHMLEPGFYRRFKRTWFRTWLGRGLRRARLIVCPSEHTRSELLARFDLERSRCVVVPNSLAPSFITDADRPEATDRPFFLAVGTIEPRKNIGRLIEAFAACRTRGLTERLVLAGRPGHGADRLLRRIASSELRDCVDVRPSTSDDELRALYQGATALVFPSLDEGFGLPILEAMHAGTPVLTSSISATAEVAGDAAMLVNPTDTAQIAAAMQRIATDPTLRAELRERGRQRVRGFDPRRQGRDVADHLAAMTSG